MKIVRRCAPLAGVLGVCALAAPTVQAQAPATVTVRVEGVSETLVPTTTVTTSTTPVRKQADPTQTCSGTSVGGALEVAVSGDWGGSYTAFGQSVERIRGESYPLAAAGRYWTLWVNGRPADVGACARELGQGDEVIIFVDCFGGGCPESPEPLRVDVPNSARAGVPFTVRVEELGGERASAVAGATVRGLGTATSNADGLATLVAERAGTYTLSIEAPGKVRTTATVRVLEADAVEAPGAPPAVAVPGPVPGPAGLDRSPPGARIVGIAEGERFSRARAPRTLRASVGADPSGLARVELRLTRRDGRSCAYLSVRRERFIRARCGLGISYRIGDGAQVSYLLPERLRAGRYVLDVVAVDRAGNRDRLARGSTRVVFRVR